MGIYGLTHTRASQPHSLKALLLVRSKWGAKGVFHLICEGRTDVMSGRKGCFVFLFLAIILRSTPARPPYDTRGNRDSLIVDEEGVPRGRCLHIAAGGRQTTRLYGSHKGGGCG
jgi:hypothetical protein